MERGLEKKRPLAELTNVFKNKAVRYAPYKHFLLLLYWPLFLAVFKLAESGVFTKAYHLVQCPLDEGIPFCEYFVVPYVLWFLFVGGMAAYTVFFEKKAFVRYMSFIMITYTAALIAFFLFPTVQQLRPSVFTEPNLFTGMVIGIYSMDTNTNVCPSVHVIGQIAVLLAAFDCKRFAHRLWKIFFIIATIAVCASTVFIKQHSILDVFAALAVCLPAYFFVYRKTNRSVLGKESFSCPKP